MYRLLHGDSGWPMEMMYAWGLKPDMVGRYRDHWLEQVPDDADTLILALYTRNGGGNREEYADQLRRMHELVTFVSDEDDTFDPTYCTLRFRLTRTQFIAWTEDAESEAEVETGQDKDAIWDEFFRQSEPNPRDMSLIWQAMLATLPGAIPDEKA